MDWRFGAAYINQLGWAGVFVQRVRDSQVLRLTGLGFGAENIFRMQGSMFREARVSDVQHKHR